MSDVFCTVPEQDQVIDFFDFQFTVGGGELKQCIYHGEKIDDEF